MLRSVFPLILSLAVLSAPAAAQTKDTLYEVYALRYAVIPGFPVAALVAGAELERKMDVAMMVWLLKGPGGRNILVDSGFYREKHLQSPTWTIQGFVKPSDALAPLGLQPEDITDVIITHMHWDHAGGLELFPKARLWIQHTEYSYYTGEAWQLERDPGGIDPEDVLALVRLNTTGRVRFVAGDAQEIFPGVICYTGGRHTRESQFVGVRTRAGTLVLASDNMYLYENLEKRVPIAQTWDPDSNLRAQDRMKQLAARPALVIPGHDPAVLRDFPAVAPGITRLD